MKNIKINYYFENNEEKISKKKLAAILNNSILRFNIGFDTFKLNLKENELEKENSESKLKLKFNINKEEKGSYYIKELNGDFDVLINTKLLENNKSYNVNYSLKINQEDLGNFILKIEFMEE